MKHKRLRTLLLCAFPAVAILACVPAEARRRRPRKGAEPPSRPRRSQQITMDTVRRKLDLARRTLEHVEQSAKRPRLAAELEAMARLIEAAGDGGDPKPLFEKASALRRRIVLSHPALEFDRLLVNRNPPPLYSHNCDQYLGRHSRKGKGLVILENWKGGKPTETTILRDKLPPGAICKPKLSWDAKRVLFAFCDHTEKEKTRRRYFIHEGALDGSWTRQITGTPRDPMARWGGRETVLIEDGDPCYLPGGGVAFVSSRSQGFGRCHNGRYTPAFLLYRADLDGGDLRQISFGEANENDPVALDDGRIVYTRWDYINRNVTMFHMLWWTRPDGTNVSNFYGSNTEKPWMISSTAPVPGSQKVVALATGHHSFSTGCIVLIDPTVGEDGEAPVRRITPEVGWFEAERLAGPGCYSTPWPLTEHLFLAAYSPQVIPKQGRVPVDDYAIYLVDSFGGRELIYRDPDMSCFSPTPVVPRPRPKVLSSVLREGVDLDTGILAIQDVYLNMHDPDGKIKRGDIKALRINRMIGQPATNKNNSQPSLVRHEVAKKLLGTVPVGADGSATFYVPAAEPLQLQALDASGMAIMTMRTFLYVQPGETRSCIGCHEERGIAPSPVRGKTLAKRPATIAPPEGPSYEGGFS
ncbi:MAG: HzsA-related protein, partial [Planctomycetota bacterium]